MIINIRGTNGAGKTTTVRHFIHSGPNVDLCWYDRDTNAQHQPGQKHDGREKSVEGYGSKHVCANGVELDVVVVGAYRTATGGMDTVPTFQLAFAAIARAAALGTAADLADHVICEGILSSTVYGSWGEFSEGRDFAFAYLQTPLDICLERIRKRQEASGKVRPIKEELVRNKVKAIASTRRRAIAAGRMVFDLPLDSPEVAVELILQGKGDVWRAR